MRKTLIKIMIIVLILCAGLHGYSIAADTATCKLDFTGASSSYTPGSEVQITLKMSSITGTGFAALGGDLSYDESVFEDLDFVKVTGWEAPGNLEGHVDVYTEGFENVTTDTNVFTIKAKIKSSAADGTYEIKLENIELAGDASYEIAKASVPIVVKAGSTPVTPTNNTVNNTTVNNTVVNNTVTNNTVTNNVVNNTTVNNTVNNTTNTNNSTTNTNTPNTTNTNNSVINTIIPYAGVGTPIFGIGILVLAIAGGTALYKYNKYKSLK